MTPTTGAGLDESRAAGCSRGLWSLMANRWALVAVSAAQLGAGVTGQVVALHDQRPFDVPIGWRGRPERIGHDSWLLGTGLSAPVIMLVAQAGVTGSLARRPSRWATRTLGILGTAMVGGYLLEKEFRAAMAPSGFDPVITPIAAAGVGLAVAMAAIGLLGPPGD
jgi:hypothetical protein